MTLLNCTVSQRVLHDRLDTPSRQCIKEFRNEYINIHDQGINIVT